MDKEFTDRYVSLHRSRLAESYKHVSGFLQEHGIPYLKSNASLFLMVKLTAAAHHHVATDDGILALLRKEKVYLTAASSYRVEVPGCFRLVIAHPRYVLDEGLKRMLRALS